MFDSGYSPQELLQRCLNASDEEAFVLLRDELVQRYAMPAVETAVRLKMRDLRADDAAAMAENFHDICNEALIDVMTHLENRRRSEDRSPIDNFEGYAFTVAVNVFQRHRFKYFRGVGLTKLRVRAAISRSDILESWRLNGIEYCGLTKHAGDVQLIDEAKLLSSLKENIGRLTYLPLHELVVLVLERLGHGIEVKQIVSIARQTLASERLITETEIDALDTEIAIPAIEEKRVEQDQLVERMWHEILDLSPKQRAALLLYESDDRGNSLVESLFNSGVAKLSDIAAALEIEKEECVVLISRIPLKTEEIALRLGIEAGSVYDIRQSAQRTLSRRFGGGSRRLRR